MASYYGQPITEEERRRRELEAAYGIEPGPVDTHAPTLSPTGPARDPSVALSPMDGSSRSMQLDPMGGGGAPPVGSIAPPPELPEAPERQGMSAGQVGAIGLAGLADALSVYPRLKGRNLPLYGPSVAQSVSSNVAAENAAAERNWRAEVQDALANRRLAVGEQQERRADAEYQSARDPSSPRSRRLQERARQMREQGILNATDEQIATMTPQSWEDGSWAREAQSERGFKQSVESADLAQERRMGEESEDTQEQLELLRAIDYPGADKVDANDPQAVARFIQVTEGAMNREQREKLARIRASKKKSSGPPRPFMTTQDLIHAPEEVRIEHINELERDLAQSREPQDRMVLSVQLEQARNVQDRRIDGLMYIGDTVPTDYQYKESIKQKAALDEFTAKTREGVEKLKELKKYGNNMDVPEAYRAYKDLLSIQEQREAIGRQIYNFGAPQAHEKMPIKNAVGDLTGLVDAAMGAGESVATNNVRLAKEKAYTNLRSLNYGPAKEDEARQGQGQGDEDEQRDILEEARRRGMMR